MTPEKMSIGSLFRMLHIVALLAAIAVIAMTGFGVHSIFSLYITSMAKNESILISKLLVDQQHDLLFTEADNTDRTLAINPDYLRVLDQNIRTFLPHFNIVKIKIFTPDTNIIYSTDSDIIGIQNPGNIRLQRALGGEVNSHIESKNSLRDLNQEEKLDVDVVETYVPILDNDNIVGVFELYKDVTTYRDEIQSITIQTVGLLTMIMLIVYLIAVAVARTGMVRAEESEEKLRVQAITDTLTGIYNRGELMARGEEETSRVLRRGPDDGQDELSLIMIDIDHFKRVNDTFGHQAGDAVLGQLAGRIKQRLRPYDILGRYGGEEFMLILPTTDLQVSERIAERIRISIEAEPFSYNGSEIHVTISLGVATFAPNFILDETISRADKALYRAKKNGRNRVETETSPTT